MSRQAARAEKSTGANVMRKRKKKERAGTTSQTQPGSGKTLQKERVRGKNDEGPMQSGKAG